MNCTCRDRSPWISRIFAFHFSNFSWRGETENRRSEETRELRLPRNRKRKKQLAKGSGKSNCSGHNSGSAAAATPEQSRKQNGNFKATQLSLAHRTSAADQSETTSVRARGHRPLDCVIAVVSVVAAGRLRTHRRGVKIKWSASQLSSSRRNSYTVNLCACFSVCVLVC